MGKSKRDFRKHKAGDKRRKKGAGKILLVTFGFIIFFVLCLSGFFYIKKWMHDGISGKGISSSKRINYDRRKPNNSQEKIAKEKKTRSSVELAKLPKQKPSIVESDRKIFDKERPKVVIIVDDLGFKKEPIDKLLEIPAQLSFAVLPNLPYSQYAAEMANKNGRDVILHLPMEPTDSSGHAAVDAGEDVLLMGLPKDKILEKLEKNLASIPYIKGVSNHMGSKFTENTELMELILQEIKNKGLFFVDSKTSLRTTGLQVAKKLGMKAAERDIFLDEGSQRSDYIRSHVEKLINVSKEKGYAIGICHPYPDTVKVLSEVIPDIQKEVEIIPVSGVVK
ncbi:MAG: divergent polysaccharide deacetylase family protein [Thermodesulfobacteriota bacterium]